MKADSVGTAPTSGPPPTADESLLRAIVQLEPRSARAKRVVALVIIGVPTVGLAIAIYLMATGRATVLDYTLFAVFWAIDVGGVSMGYHRYVAHKSFKTSAFFEGVLLIAASTALEGPVLHWVATHRRHHRFSDEQGDPHSPHLSGPGIRGALKGLWYAHIPWMLSDQESRVNVLAPDVLRTPRLYFYNRTYEIWALLGLVLPAVAGWVIGGNLAAAFSGFIFGGLARVCLAHHAMWCVGSISHWIGSRPFSTGDHSANNWPVAFFTFGEGLQNNHHAFPGAYRHGMRWWEPDLSAWILYVLGKMGIVWDLHMPSRKMIDNRLKRNKTASATPLTSAAITEEV
jgi:stearoyl-CoA desaturase (Delta-9 desaturase)